MRTLLLATALAALPTIASASDMVRVDREGYKLEYRVTPQLDGSELISGRELTSQQPFAFKVAGRRVTGDVNGRPVSFLVPRPHASRADGE